jgi:uncharacterized protein involved in response to NO
LTRLDLIRAGPYRVMFPLGVLCGLLGVGHWFLWSSGLQAESHSTFHASIQVQGFLSCFVVGFLMTALPRFLGAPPASLGEVSWAAGTAVCFVVFTLASKRIAAQSAFLALLGLLPVFALRRLPHRTKNPPASFILIAFGWAHAVAGSALMLAGIEVGRQVLQIGFLLCLVLGVAGYLAPFQMGYAGDPSCDPNVSPLRGINPASLSFHALAGTLIAASFFIEPHHAVQAARLRAGVALIHLGVFARIYRPLRMKRTHTFFFWLACCMVPVGLAAACFGPDYRIAALHLVFISGFSLMIFSFGLMVVLSHGAEAPLLSGPLIPLRIVGVAVFLAAPMRGAADVDAWHNRLWLQAASGTWLLAASFWLGYVFPKLWRIPVGAGER